MRINIKGQVIKKISDFFYVNFEGKIYESKPRGIFKKEKKNIIVGDFVEITLKDDTTNEAVIETIYPRKNSLIRPNVANIDNMVVVFAAKEPLFNYYLADVFLATTENVNINTILAINKIDLDENQDYLKQEEVYSKIGYKTVSISAHNNIGIDELKNLLLPGSTVISGPSGVGKSSIINKIIGNSEQKTSKISTKLQKGKNTTTYATMIPIEDGKYIVDTPGFTSIKLDNIDKYDLKKCFVEFEQYDDNCYFGAKCLHDKEPYCSVKDALAEGKIFQSRYDSYLTILSELSKKDNRRNYK